jgi:hypothetical protein
VLQVGGAQIVCRTQVDVNFSIPQHCYEYLSTLGWFWDNFDHPQRIKLLYLAASYLNQNAWTQRKTGDLEPIKPRPAAGADKLTAEQILDRLDAAVLALDGPQSLAWAKAYLDGGAERGRLIQHIALLASRVGNDPHNQEIAQCLLDDYSRNRSEDRDWLLLAAAHHTARHRKYGDFLEASRRFGSAMGVPRLQ